MEKHIKMQTRDWDLLRFIEEQGFVSYRQIRENFFEHQPTCSNRLIDLVRTKYLSCEPLLNFFQKNKESGYFFPHLLNLNIDPREKVYFLNRNYARGFGKSQKLFKKNMILHQLILSGLRLELQNSIEFKQINNDPILHILNGIQPGRNREIIPDMCFEYDNIKIAIELELTLKAQAKYSQRFSYYRDSIYTHIIYYYSDEAYLRNLIKKASFDPKFAFAHYKTPKDLFSNVLGRISLGDFLFKVQYYKNRR